jgi:hypothetical protein
LNHSPFGQLVRSIAVKALSDKTISDNEKSLFTNRTVGELLFEGFNLKLFEQIENLAKSLNITIKLNPFSIYEGVSVLISKNSSNKTKNKLFQKINK